MIIEFHLLAFVKVLIFQLEDENFNSYSQPMHMPNGMDYVGS
jgi:hypothetical protein